MRLTVLGKYGPYPPKNGATSGYLLQQGSTNLLLECGSGVLSRLQQYLRLGDLSAVLLSHLHSDHMSDLLVLRYALMQMQQRGMNRNLPLKVFAPDLPRKESDLLRGQGVYELITISDGMYMRLGDFDISFHVMTHPVPSYGMLFYAENKIFAYTGDTCMHDDLMPFAINADLLLADTSLLNREKTSPLMPHLTAGEAGELAAAASVKRLLCTHIHPNTDEDELRLEAARAYPAAEIAKEGRAYEI